MIIIVAISFAIIALMDVPGLIKSGYKRDLAVYSVIYFFALVMSIVIAIGVVMPSSTMWFEHFIKDVLHLSYKP